MKLLIGTNPDGTTFPTVDFTEEVTRGAALLDHFDPDWDAFIDLESLDLGDGEVCVLGQVFIHDQVMRSIFKLEDSDSGEFGDAVVLLSRRIHSGELDQFQRKNFALSTQTWEHQCGFLLPSLSCCAACADASGPVYRKLYDLAEEIGIQFPEYRQYLSQAQEWFYEQLTFSWATLIESRLTNGWAQNPVTKELVSA
jgi:hypothetical protein